MLQAIRSKAGSIVVKALFAALIASFGIWGIGDIFRNRAPDTDVATVGGRSIDADALQNALRPALDRLSVQTGSSVDLQRAKELGIVDDVLRQLINEDLADQEAARLQLDVSDEVLRSAVTQNPNFRGPTGAFDRAAFDAALAANHMSEDQFVALSRREIRRTDLLGAVTAGAAAPGPMVDLLYRYRDERRTADIVTLPIAGAGDAGQPSEAELTAFYNAHKDMFRSPEYRAFTLESLTPSELAQKIEIPEAQLQQEYDQRRGEFVVPERRDVQQILTSSEEKAKAAEAALAAGKDWQQVATTIAGQAPDTIDLGLVKREEMPSELADVAFKLALNKPSAPLKSPLGWHILRVVKIAPPATQTFAEAKAKLQAEIANHQAVDRIYKIANHVDDALAGGATLAEAAAKFGLKKTVVAAIDVHGLDRDGKKVALPISPADVVKLVFATDEGQTSRVTETDDNAVYVLRTDKVIPPGVKPLAEVKEEAITAWQVEKRRETVAKEAAALAASVTPGMRLAAMAAAKGLKATTSPPLLRRPSPGDTLPPALVAKLFSIKPGEVAVASDSTGSYVAQLDTVTTPENGPQAAAAKTELSRELTAGLQADLGDEFMQSLRSRFPVEIRRETLDRLF